jgi:ribonuclease BN (tRNA processing enzyme)
MADFAKGADLLVHEALLTDGVDALVAKVPNGDDRLRTHILRSHTAAEDVGRIARDAGVARLALNHFVPDGLPGFAEADWEAAVRKTWHGPLVLGRDGIRIEL